MGRALRRRLERQNAKNKVHLSKHDIETLKKDITQEVGAYDVEALMTCFGLALRRVYGFGTDRITRTLNEVDDLMGAILDDTATIEGYKAELENETGIKILSEG